MLKALQWNPFCESTPFSPEKWPFKRGGFSSGVEINTFMLRLTVSSGLSGVVGLTLGWSQKRFYCSSICSDDSMQRACGTRNDNVYDPSTVACLSRM